MFGLRLWSNRKEKQRALWACDRSKKERKKKISLGLRVWSKKKRKLEKVLGVRVGSRPNPKEKKLCEMYGLVSIKAQINK